MYASLVWDNGTDTLFYYLKPYNSKTFPNTYGYKSRIRKYQNWWLIDEKAPTGYDGISEIDEKCLRFADILLMDAEALTMQNKVADAYIPVNKVRARALLSPLAAGFTQDQMMAEIRHQRMIEFFREGQRFYDLRRWGLLEQEIKDPNTDKQNNQNFQLKYQYLPLPQTELDANPNLTQNDPW
jgi:hypothetical protein